MKKKISILGSTGSIGVNSLEVIKTAPETFEVAALAAGYNTHLLLEQIQKFHPRLVSVATETLAEDIREQFPSIEVLWGEKGLKEVATYSESNFVISALVGAKGIEPTLAAISSQKEVALANKEVLVAAGELVMEEVQRQHVQLLPIDSEHSAIFQVLEQKNRENLKKIVNGYVECPWHRYQFSVQNGLGPPGFADCIAYYDTQVQNGAVYVSLERVQNKDQCGK